LMILGAAGAVGSELARKLGAEGHALRLIDRDGPALEALAKQLGAEAHRLDLGAAAPQKSHLEGIDLVIDAAGPIASRDLTWARAALEAGCDWLDLAETRERAIGIEELNDLAVERGRVALSAAGTFCGLTEPFVREAIDDLTRVNEVLFGVLLGNSKRFGPGSVEAFARSLRNPVRMLIGGEWTQREPFGDIRAFPHPEPFGPVKSGNLDGADLEVYTRKGYKSASVRISLGVPSGWKRRALMRLSRKARLKPTEDATRLAKKLRRWSSSKPAEGCLTMVVRGINAKRMPQETRLALVGPPEGLALVTTPIECLVPRLSGATRPEAGARPCTGVLGVGELLARLEGQGVRVHRGDLTGWRS
jgi:hypothetical protein